MTEFICEKCGLQKAKEFKIGFVKCPKCQAIAALGAVQIHATDIHAKIKALEHTLADYGEKLHLTKDTDMAGKLTKAYHETKVALDQLKALRDSVKN